MAEVDIWSKGEVVRYLQHLLEAGKIKNCKNMKVNQGFMDVFYSECIHNWASWNLAYNVSTNSTGYSAPSSYSWPECPSDCPKYSKSDNFIESLIATGKEILPTGNYVDLTRIQEFKSIKSCSYDTSKLVRLCEELNLCYSRECVFATAMLIRAILDHVPPIFKMDNFEQVVSNYKWSISNKKVILNLQNFLRNIADSYLHTKIREKESLPNMTQVDFKNALDVLLQEIVRLLRNKNG